jgi:2-keto-3-deoxy-L-rhamnonate aldolase RhmA
MEFITRLHRCLDESRTAAGMFVCLNSPEVAEFLIHGVKMDFVATELQHCAVSSGDSMHLLRAIQAADPMVTPLVRLPNHDVYWIQQSLDGGYVGLIAPLVESAEQAKRLVKAAYFPPRGDRSIAGSIRAAMYDQELRVFNDRMILLPQIESAKGLEHAEEVASVDGVTGLLLGPSDLSLSCGWDLKNLWTQAPFLDAVNRVIAVCRKHGKHAAVLTDKFVEARKAGFDIIGIGGDAGHVRNDMVASINSKLAQLR